MDIESLKLFLDIRNSGTITGAANDNYLSQSTLSKRLSALEKELGVTLFQRSKGQAHAIITPAGEAFSDIAERIVFLHQQALELHNDTERRSLSIASINSVQNYSLPPFVTRFQEQFPHLCITLETHHSVEIFSLLENKRIDIGITQAESPFPDLKSDLLFQEPYRVVKLLGEHGDDPCRPIHPSTLPAAHEIFEAFDAQLQNWHDYWWKPMQAKLRVNMTPTAERYFNSTEDWSIVPEEVARQMEQKGFRSYPLCADPPLRSVFITYHRQTGKPLVKDFVRAAKQFFQNSRAST